MKKFLLLFTLFFTTQALGSQFVKYNLLASPPPSAEVGTLFQYYDSLGALKTIDSSGTIAPVVSSPTGTPYSTAVFDVAGSLANSFTLLDSAGLIALDLDLRNMSTSAGSISLDWENRQIYDAAATAVIDYGGWLVNDTTGAMSIAWGDRLLGDPSGITSVDYGARTLPNSSNTPTLNWESGLLNDSTGQISANWFTRLLSDTAGSSVAQWGAGALQVIPLSTTNKLALTPAQGMIAADSTIGGLEWYSGSAWSTIPADNGTTTTGGVTYFTGTTGDVIKSATVTITGVTGNNLTVPVGGGLLIKNLTHSRVLVSGGLGTVAESPTTNAELAELSGITSAAVGVDDVQTLTNKTLTSPVINTASVTLTTAGGTPSTLDYYEEFSGTVTLTDGAGFSQTGTAKITRIGRIVIAEFPSMLGTSSSTNDLLLTFSNSGNNIPTRFAPTTARAHVGSYEVFDNTSAVTGTVSISSSTITFTVGVTGGASTFTASGTKGILPNTVTWQNY